MEGDESREQFQSDIPAGCKEEEEEEEKDDDDNINDINVLMILCKSKFRKDYQK